MSKKAEVSYEDMIFMGKILRWYGNAKKPAIKELTENGGWSILCHGTKEQMELAWSRMYADRELDRAIRKEGCRLVIVDAVSSPRSVEKANAHSVGISKQPNVHRGEHLKQAAYLINKNYEILTNPNRAAGRAVIEIGIFMLAAKDQLPHGHLEKWRDENTKLTKTWDTYCRRAARKFIDEHGMQAAALLCDPSQAESEEDVKQAEQMLLDFTGGKGPSALLDALGIKKRSAESPAPLPDGETPEHLNAVQIWTEVCENISRFGLSDNPTWAHLNIDERQGLYDQLRALELKLKPTLKD